MISPIGIIELQSNGVAVTAIQFVDEPRDQEVDQMLEIAQVQLQDYFEGSRQNFDVPLAPLGTAFQIKVWEELRHIPFGTTISYGDLARKLGSSGLMRAVGNANGKNPIAIVIPCHRVIGSSGQLTGYAGGLHRKQWLLEHELKLSGKARQLALF